VAYLSAMWNGTQQETAFIREHGAYIATVWVGYDSVLPLTYHLLVEMYPTNDGTEYAFGILQHDRLTQKSDMIFDSSISNAIIPKWHRPKIRDLLIDLTERVVRGCNRDAFFMVTYCDHLPDKALEKYAVLCDVFERCGYNCVQSVPVPGKHFWQMTRQDATVVDGDDKNPP
jgi:hypothetical protein